MIIKMGRRIKTLKACMVLLGVGGLLAFGAYQFTDNLSTAIIIFAITIGLIFVAHPDTKIFISFYPHKNSIIHLHSTRYLYQDLLPQIRNHILLTLY